MDDEFSSLDCSWYWDNYDDLSPVGLTDVSSENNLFVHLDSSLLRDSAFHEPEAESISEKNVIHPDLFKLLHIAGEDSSHRHYWIENLSNIGLYYDEHCQSDSSVDSQSSTELSASDGCAESSNIEEFETSDIESQGCSTRCDSLLSRMQFSSTSSLSDTSFTFSGQEESDDSDNVTDNSNQLSDGIQNADVHVASASVGNESQLQQHQPLVFFIIGLFVGLSLGFFTCIVAMSAAVHRMHLEIVSGRTLYTECQNKVNVDVLIGSIWQEKFKEMVIENAELQVKLSSVEKQMPCSLDRMNDHVAQLNTELLCLKCCVDNNASSLSGDVLTGDNNSSQI